MIFNKKWLNGFQYNSRWIQVEFLTVAWVSNVRSGGTLPLDHTVPGTENVHDSGAADERTLLVLTLQKIQ